MGRVLSNKMPFRWSIHLPLRHAMWAVVALLCGGCIALFPPLDLVLLFLLIGIAVGSLYEPLVGVIGGVIFGPLRAWLAIFAPQIPDQLGQVFFMLGVVGWVACGLVRRDLRLHLGPLTAALLAFVGAGLLSLWSPFDVWAGFTEWAKWLQVLLTLWVLSDRLQNSQGEKRVTALLIALGIIGAGQGVMGIWQHSFRGTGPLHFLIAPGIYRAYGTFMQPNPFGGFLGLLGALFAGLVFVVVWEALQTRCNLPRWIWLAAGVLLMVLGGLYGSWSRGAWMAFVAALGAMLAMLPRRSVWGVVSVVALVGVVLLLMVTNTLPTAVEARLTDFVTYVRFQDVRGVGINDANYAVMERMAHWQAALGMWESNFWMGVGIGNYEAAYPFFRLVNWPYALGHAHNFYLNLLAETGVIGLGAYLLLLTLIYVRLWQVARTSCSWRRGLAIGMMGAWTQINVHNLVDNVFVNNVHLHVGVLLGLTVWLVYLTTNARQASVYDRILGKTRLPSRKRLSLAINSPCHLSAGVIFVNGAQPRSRKSQKTLFLRHLGTSKWSSALPHQADL